MHGRIPTLGLPANFATSPFFLFFFFNLSLSFLFFLLHGYLYRSRPFRIENTMRATDGETQYGSRSLLAPSRSRSAPVAVFDGHSEDPRLYLQRKIFSRLANILRKIRKMRVEKYCIRIQGVIVRIGADTTREKREILILRTKRSKKKCKIDGFVFTCSLVISRRTFLSPLFSVFPRFSLPFSTFCYIFFFSMTVLLSEHRRGSAVYIFRRKLCADHRFLIFLSRELVGNSLSGISRRERGRARARVNRKQSVTLALGAAIMRGAFALDN